MVLCNINYSAGLFHCDQPGGYNVLLLAYLRIMPVPTAIKA